MIERFGVLTGVCYRAGCERYSFGKDWATSREGVDPVAGEPEA